MTAHQPTPMESPSARNINFVVELATRLEKEMQSVDRVIINCISSHISLIPDISGHLIQAGGKRIRPLLVLACANLLGYQGTRHHALAASIEFLHTATLLHDDVIDESNLRRGKPTAHMIWGNQASILVGDFLLSQAFQMMVADGDMEVLQLLSKTASTIIQGEIHQLTRRNQLATTFNDYLQIIEAKTAELFAASCQVGGIVADASDQQKQALISYGYNLGMVFQFMDDSLDYLGNEKSLGKPVGTDFYEGKITLPVLLAYEAGTVEEKAFWARTLGDLNQQEEDLDQAIALMKHHNIAAHIEAKAQPFIAAAQQQLAHFAPSKIQELLKGLTQASLTRVQ